MLVRQSAMHAERGVGRAGSLQDTGAHGWPLYCASLTCSSHSTTLPFSALVIAMWLMRLVAVALCQCFTVGGIQTTSPGWICPRSPPHSCTQPVPDVTISV